MEAPVIRLFRWAHVDLDEYDARLRRMTSDELAAEGRRLQRMSCVSAFVLVPCASVLAVIALIL